MFKKIFKKKNFFLILGLLLISFIFIQKGTNVFSNSSSNALFLKHKGDIYIDEKDDTLKLSLIFVDSKNSTLFNDLNEKIKSELEEMIMDMRISLATNNIGSNVSGESVTNTRLAANVFVSVISATLFVWNPLGWSVAVGTVIVGILGSIFTSLFTSKSEKIRKATENLRKQLYDSIDSGIDKNLKQVLVNTRKSINDTYKTIDSVFNAYTKNADDIIMDMEKLVKQVQENENAINSLVSLRILDFVGKNPVKEISINEMSNQVLCDGYPVERDWKKQSIKFLYDTGLTGKNIQKIEKATQMTIKTK